LWAILGNNLPSNVILEHLVDLPNSLKSLGSSNRDGWGLAYYNGDVPVVLRGEPPANIDPNFVLAAHELAESGSNIQLGHVRIAASGASEIPNPHPFIRYKGGKWWAFGHNGVLSKTLLVSLNGPEYLQQNPPAVGDNWTDPATIDSDLYMLYILKRIEENEWNATLGIAEAVNEINAVGDGGMNFFLTDGETLWGFCEGNSLYFYSDETSQYSVIASQPPTGNDSGWTEMQDHSLIILSRNGLPQIVNDITAVPEFPHLAAILPLLIMVTFVTTMTYRRRTKTRIPVNHEAHSCRNRVSSQNPLHAARASYAQGRASCV
jgi:predicted glutamine amidotransferase